MQANSSVSIDLKDPNGETKLKAFFDAILKDKNSYFLVDKLEILKENEQVKPFLEMLKKIDEKNAYIKQEGTSDVLD
jgi:mevalonate pyrophosphate decarboxylase